MKTITKIRVACIITWRVIEVIIVIVCLYNFQCFVVSHTGFFSTDKTQIICIKYGNAEMWSRTEMISIALFCVRNISAFNCVFQCSGVFRHRRRCVIRGSAVQCRDHELVSTEVIKFMIAPHMVHFNCTLVQLIHNRFQGCFRSIVLLVIPIDDITELDNETRFYCLSFPLFISSAQ
ncbi:hypothetical protein ANANG_G00036550 [Anguilla anguilla]|uniref:Uncharacterized protein n=1 Tax=Anguilla anguilla TaxID=7936 RepID=A0A9D3MVY8_ANGAN|nr:hypothetical protein ANANG_G00036550 [Anguilla anguilla]